MDDGERQVIDDIAQYGWHVIKVADDDEGPAFAFTIGFYRSFQRPEVIITGLPLEVAHVILNAIGDSLRRGEQYQAGGSYDTLLEGYDCTFRTVPKEQYREFLGTAMWYYRGTDFPCLQCIWPDRAGRWPWEPEASDSFRAAQPLVATP